MGIMSQQVFPPETIRRVRHVVSDHGTSVSEDNGSCYGVPSVGTYRGEPCGVYHSGYIRW